MCSDCINCGMTGCGNAESIVLSLAELENGATSQLQMPVSGTDSATVTLPAGTGEKKG